MSDPDASYRCWITSRFYKGHLAAVEMRRTLDYCVLATKSAPTRSPALFATTPPVWPNAQPDSSNSNNNKAMSFPSTPQSDPFTLSPAGNEVSAGEGSAQAPLPPPRPTSANVSRAESTDSAAALSTNNNNTEALFDSNPTRSGIVFYVFKKKDVQPPHISYTLSKDKVNSCFYFCEKPQCTCDRLHVSPHAWRVRVDVLARTCLHVIDNNQDRYLLSKEILPTAGYFLSLALRHLKVVAAVVPILCRFNGACKNGCHCLYIHANISPAPYIRKESDIALRQLSDSGGGLPGPEVQRFFDFLDDEGIITVGDMQSLGLGAFEALRRRVPPHWAEAFLLTSIFRHLDVKMPLEDLLVTFPRVNLPIRLPACLVSVGDLLKLPEATLFQVDLTPMVMSACEIIRGRSERHDEHLIVSLQKEPAGSFFVRVAEVVKAFRERHAHCSWRKHDPKRPVVTSILTYVDVNVCVCGEALRREENGSTLPATVSATMPPIPVEEEVGVPAGSWCLCPRRWVVAVNYELSTPSGSRCSEQNAMGKVASLGVPTWGIREVFVHGVSSKKDPNPLFPCGVCENMLQKVTKDVESKYGGDVILYMFDGVEPHKLVYLPVPEISHRDGSSFKRFLADEGFKER